MKLKSQKSKIIFISNRFGYGPTITLLHIIREFITNTDAELIFAGSGICKEAFDFTLNDRVAFIDMDERNIDDIRSLLSKCNDGRLFVVSCLNRLAIQAAKELDIPNTLIDFLTWMWNEIPKGCEYTDYYFSNHFGTKNKKDKMIEVPLILGPTATKNNSNKEYLLINIGGTQTHLVPGIPKKYLTLLSQLLNRLIIPKGLKVVVAGGSQAISFLKDLNQRPEFRIESLSSEEYISIQQKSEKIISLAGTNSTFMSFVLDLPVVFLLPQLYAHWKLTQLLKERKYITDCQQWDDYLKVPKDINSLTEKDSIFLIEDLSDTALKDNRILDSITKDLQVLIDKRVDISGQRRFIDEIGIGGEKIVINRLKEVWNL